MKRAARAVFCCVAALLAGAALAQNASITEAPVADELRRTVVSIRWMIPPDQKADETEEFFRRFMPQAGQWGADRYLATGLIVSADGDILTGSDWVENSRAKLVARFSDGREAPLRLVARDRRTALALLKVEKAPDAAQVAKVGDAVVGDRVLAVAMQPGKDAPIGSAGTVRLLQVSGAAASLTGFIETDVGNIDGPIFNARGEVIGINLYVRREDQKRAFALPMATAMWVREQLREHGRVIRGRIGVAVDAVGEMTALAQGGESDLGGALLEGALVRSVEKGGPAERAGLRAGDILIEIDGKPVRKPLDAIALISASRPGSVIALTVRREGGAQVLQATVAEFVEPVGRAFETRPSRPPAPPRPAPESIIPQ